MRLLWERMLQVILPEHCVGCGAPRVLLCEPCLQRVDYPHRIEEGGVFAAASYADRVAREAIWAFKYRHGRRLAEPLAELLVERVWPHIERRAWNVVPVPLSAKRYRERGFNQAELLARIFAERTGTMLRVDLAVKHRHTPSQVSVEGMEKRRENISGAFRVTGNVRGAYCIVVDDVATTGATIHEVRNELLSNGAQRAIGVVVARG